MTYYLRQVGRFWIVYCNKMTLHSEGFRYEVCRATNEIYIRNLFKRLTRA